MNTEKAAKQRAKPGLSASATKSEIKAAKQLRRDVKARAMGLPPGLSKAQFHEAMERTAASAGMSVERMKELIGVTRADQLPAKQKQ